MMYIYPYKQGSNSVAVLAEALGAKIIRLENSKFKGNPKKTVINWGNSMTDEEIEKANVINKPSLVAAATNKLAFFNQVQGVVNIPPFTTNSTQAHKWLLSGKKIVVREKLNGHSGEGIVILQDESQWEMYDHRRAKMYVVYIPKMDEYRVHVMANEVIDVQRKAINSNTPKDQINHQIRNHHNGYVYVREGVMENCPPMVLEQALLSIQLTGLHFGAVDIIWNKHKEQAYVLEVNTAPGLQGATIEKYSSGLSAIIAAYEADINSLVHRTNEAVEVGF
jgi:glutathione synthase/RimK-type ligase-like ATP-grasp enzyme